MAQFRTDEADHYGGNGGGGFFALKNDKDTAHIRFMYNTIDDIIGTSVHQVEIDGKLRYVNCLRDYKQPIDDCPFCAAKIKLVAKYFIPIFNIDTNEVMIWERGKNFGSKLQGLATRHKPLVATPFEIERNGKVGDTATTYETYALDRDETTLEDLPEAADPLGTIILDKTFEDLEVFVAEGFFPADEDEDPEPPVRQGRGARPTSAATQTRPTAARTGKPDLLPPGLANRNPEPNRGSGRPTTPPQTPTRDSNVGRTQRGSTPPTGRRPGNNGKDF